MLIHEAILATTVEYPYVTRKHWLHPSTGEPIVMILPTDSPECCLIFSDHAKPRHRRGWEPTRQDLMADDWMISTDV